MGLVICERKNQLQMMTALLNGSLLCGNLSAVTSSDSANTLYSKSFMEIFSGEEDAGCEVWKEVNPDSTQGWDTENDCQQLSSKKNTKYWRTGLCIARWRVRRRCNLGIIVELNIKGGDIRLNYSHCTRDAKMILKPCEKCGRWW